MIVNESCLYLYKSSHAINIQTYTNIEQTDAYTQLKWGSGLNENNNNNNEK